MYTKTKFHTRREPIKRFRYIQSLFARYHPISPKYYPTPSLALLAGGALRDDFMGLHDSINDYDIFIKDIFPVFNSTKEWEETIFKAIHAAFPQHDLCQILFNNDYQPIKQQYVEQSDIKPGSHDQIASVWEIEEEGLTYQLIFTKNDPRVHIEKYFDFGLCKVWCDGRKIRYTSDFLHDAKNKTLTLVGDDMTEEQIEYAIEYHADKLLWKYNDFRLVIPPRYQKFVEGRGFPVC